MTFALLDVPFSGLLMEDLKQNRQLLSALCHGAGLASSMVVTLIIPIAVLCISEDSVIKANAKEAINFSINLYIWALLIVALCFVLVGFILIPVAAIVAFVLPLIGLIKVLGNPDSVYRYPFVYRFL